MKIIFLDIDGVLNSNDWYRKRSHEMNMDTVEKNYPICEFDPEAVKNLNFIVKETGAKVVISSTWRMGRTLEELQALLNSVGFEGEIVSKTPIFLDMLNHSYSVPRGCEIDHWLRSEGDFQRINWSWEEQMKYIENAKVKQYIILDDDSDMLYNQREHFVKVSNLHGLTLDLASEAVKILNTPLENIYYADHVPNS